MKKVHVWTTYGEGSFREQLRQEILFSEDSGVEEQVINLYPDQRFEVFEGFGGAVTDAAGYVYSLMSEEQKKELVKTYFSKEQMNYSMVRVHIDSCDFSTGMYEAVSDEMDTEFETFSFARTEKYILPFLEDIKKYSGKQVCLMLSPWSPPAFMKTNGSRIRGGELKPEFRKLWAEYICRYIKEFQDRGFIVNRISIQNEPHAAQPWDSCLYTAEQEKEFLRDFLYPAFQTHGFSKVEIFIWDHNKERLFERMCAVIDEETERMVSGAAFHWYSGDHFEALSLARQRFPDKKLIISESCIENSKFGGKDQIMNAQRLSHEIIGDMNHGMTAFYDWNLLLDEKGGPNHVGNFCQAPFLFDTQENILVPQLISQYFEHFSREIIKGSVRIGFSRYTDEIDVTAFERPDGKRIVITLNRSEKMLPVNLRMEGLCAAFVLPPKSIATGIISE